MTMKLRPETSNKKNTPNLAETADNKTMAKHKQQKQSNLRHN